MNECNIHQHVCAEVTSGGLRKTTEMGTEVYKLQLQRLDDVTSAVASLNASLIMWLHIACSNNYCAMCKSVLVAEQT